MRLAARRSPRAHDIRLFRKSVTGKGIEIDVELLHVDRAVGRALRAIEHNLCSNDAGGGGQPSNVSHSARYVRAMGERNQSTSRRKLRIQPSGRGDLPG